jgi:hypothetical protein
MSSVNAKYEYREEVDISNEFLNELGEQGWELVTVLVNEETMYGNEEMVFRYFFKRLKI